MTAETQRTRGPEPTRCPEPTQGPEPTRDPLSAQGLAPTGASELLQGPVVLDLQDTVLDPSLMSRLKDWVPNVVKLLTLKPYS